jgi:hypothetical protein
MKSLGSKSGRARKINETITNPEFLAKCAKDTNAYRSEYKRPPVPTGSVLVAKFVMVDGVPHKMVNGSLVALTKKLK